MIPELPRGQITAPLSAFAEIIMGQAPEGESYNNDGIGVPLIAGAADLGALAPNPKKWTTSPTKIGKNGDIIICVRATIGDLNWADKSYCYGRGVAAIRVHSDHDPEFVWYWLEACHSHLLSLGQGATFKQISKENLLSLPTPIISTTEQKRIVERIKECMERIDEIYKLREAIFAERAYLAESMIEAQLKNAKGDDVSMADVCSITSCLVDPRETQFKSMLHVGGANIESKTGRLIDLQTAAAEGLKSGKFVFDNTVVLYNKIRPYLVKVARPDFGGLCSADMYPLSPYTNKITRDYLYYILTSKSFTHYAISGSNRAGMPKVNREHLFAYRFKRPSISVQHSITEQLDLTVKAALNISSEMDSVAIESESMREAILRKAFSGEL